MESKGHEGNDLIKPLGKPQYRNPAKVKELSGFVMKYGGPFDRLRELSFLRPKSPNILIFLLY